MTFDSPRDTLLHRCDNCDISFDHPADYYDHRHELHDDDPTRDARGPIFLLWLLIGSFLAICLVVIGGVVFAVRLLAALLS